MQIKRALIAMGLMASLALAGCGSQSETAASCAPVESGVGVCLNGKALTWDAKAKPPHVHETGGYYAPVADLEKALGVKAEIAADKKSVTVKGKAVASTAAKAMNIHLHDDFVYAPIKEFAEAAGYKVEVDATKHIVSIKK